MPFLGLFLILAVQASDDRPVFTQFQISREKEEHKVSVSAKLKNPGSRDLADLWVSITYFDGERELRQSKPSRLTKLAARETLPLALEARQVEKFTRYEVSILTDERNLVYSGSPSDEAPKFQKAVAAKPPPATPNVTVELRGLKWFDRDPLEVLQEGPGDVPFLRFVVRQRGQVRQPTGKLQIMVFDGTKPLKFLNVALEDACYRRDSEELNSRTATPEMTVYDPITGEVWVGLTRVDHAKCALRLDVTFVLDGQGTWDWKGLEKVFVCEPREREKK